VGGQLKLFLLERGSFELSCLRALGSQAFQQSGQTHFITFGCYHRRSPRELRAHDDQFVEKLRYIHRNPVKRL